MKCEEEGCEYEGLPTTVTIGDKTTKHSLCKEHSQIYDYNKRSKE